MSNKMAEDILKEFMPPEDITDAKKALLQTAFMNSLTEQEKVILCYIYEDGYFLKAIAKELGISIGHTGHLKKNALAKLRQYVLRGATDDILLLKLPKDIINALRRAGVNRISDLTAFTEEHLRLIRTIGPKRILLIENVLRENGYSLAG